MRYKVRVAPKGEVEATLNGNVVLVGEEVDIPEKGVHKVETIIQNKMLGVGTLYVRKVS